MLTKPINDFNSTGGTMSRVRSNGQSGISQDTPAKAEDWKKERMEKIQGQQPAAPGRAMEPASTSMPGPQFQKPSSFAGMPFSFNQGKKKPRNMSTMPEEQNASMMPEEVNPVTGALSGMTSQYRGF